MGTITGMSPGKLGKLIVDSRKTTFVKKNNITLKMRCTSIWSKFELVNSITWRSTPFGKINRRVLKLKKKTGREGLLRVNTMFRASPIFLIFGAEVRSGSEW